MYSMYMHGECTIFIEFLQNYSILEEQLAEMYNYTFKIMAFETAALLASNITNLLNNS